MCHFITSSNLCDFRLSSSCFAELRMDKIKLEEFDTDDDESMAILRANSALSGCLPESLFILNMYIIIYL